MYPYLPYQTNVPLQDATVDNNLTQMLISIAITRIFRIISNPLNYFYLFYFLNHDLIVNILQKF